MRKKILVGCTASCCILIILFFVWKRTEYFPYMFQEKTEYGYSLEEIRERLEYVYLLDNTPEPRSERYYGELGSLPQENAVNLQLYLARGNRILFLPESKANVKIEKDGRTYNAYYSKKMQGYLFYLLCDWQTYEAGIPVNSPESSSILCCMATNEKNADKVDACSKKGMDVYDTKELFYLGEVQVDLSDAMLSSRSPIEVHDNIYVNDVMGYVADTLAQAGEYGKYNIYLNRLHRILDDKYGNGWTTSNIDCVIEGNGRQEYAQFIIYDGGDLDERVFPLSGPHLEDSLGYFSDYFSEEENRELIEKITKQPRGVITLEVTKQEKEEVRASKEYDEPDNNSEINFDIMPVEDIARKLSYACSYSNWFGMAELGAPVGTVRRFDGQEVIMYLWDYEKGLLFIPMNKVNAQLQGADETLCPVYINDRGHMEFYQLNSNQFADGSGQLDTSMITIKEYETRLAISLIKQESRVKIKIEALTELEMPSVKKDKFICAFIQQVKELLTQAGKHGTYTVQIGEYETLYTNKACISAAVIGKQDAYYIRYMIVEYEDRQYYFWPVGFGIDGSLEECASTKHSMNKTCIERTKQLNRTDIKIVLE